MQTSQILRPLNCDLDIKSKSQFKGLRIWDVCILVLIYFFQSVLYGMLFAFGYQVLLRYKWIEDNHSQHLFSRPISWLLCFLAVLGLGVRLVSFHSDVKWDRLLEIKFIEVFQLFLWFCLFTTYWNDMIVRITYIEYVITLFQSYVTFTLLCRNKPECNDVHSYIVFIPVSMSKYEDICFIFFFHYSL